MKVSFVSSQAISQAMRYQMLRMQADLVRSNTEMVTGRVADTGLALGARSGMSVSFHREVDRLKSLIDSNSFAATRLEATQIGLRELTEAVSDLMAAFSTAHSTSSNPTIAKQEADAALAALTSTLNTNLNGEYLFAGINTDMRPLHDFTDPTSPNRIAYENAFVTFFGFQPTDAAAASIDTASMDAFLDVVETQFLGADWNTLWSTATDQQITSRITLTETAQTSVSANGSGFRKLAMTAATVAYIFQGDLSEGARAAIFERSLTLLGQATTELANQQGVIGITEQRLERSNERMRMQIDLLTNSLYDLEGVDEYEASSRVTGLMAQIELSYSLTARMQQLSLLKFLS
jgi:flagellar hook-associated protein 3 FlgL